MTVSETGLEGCFLLELDSFGDDRGFFMESFNQQRVEEALGTTFDVKQVNFASSSKNAIRGLHYQDKPHAQAKLVGVTRGAVLDVVVDLRKDSPSYLKNFKVVLDRPSLQLFVPKGFAHGYKALEDDSFFYYFVDEFYAPKSEKGIFYKDAELAIDWELTEEPNVSPKDLAQPTLDKVENAF